MLAANSGVATSPHKHEDFQKTVQNMTNLSIDPSPQDEKINRI